MSYAVTDDNARRARRVWGRQAALLPGAEIHVSPQFAARM
jgi:hypothetical protein